MFPLQVREISTIPVPFSFSFCRYIIMKMLVHLIFFPREPLNSPHFYKFFFSFCCCYWWLSSRWLLCYHLTCCWFPLVHFSFQLLYSSTMIGSFIFPNPLLKLSLCSFILLSSLSIFMTFGFSSLSGIMTISALFLFFSFFFPFFFPLVLLFSHFVWLSISINFVK